MSAVESECERLCCITEQLEWEFCKFYYRVLKMLYALKNHEFSENVKSSLKRIRRLRYSDPEASSPVAEKIPYDDGSCRFAYIYAYGVIHSVIVYQHFLQFLKCNLDIRQKLMLLKRIRLCCLGAGPAIEAVAICKAISDVLQKFGPENRPPLVTYITIIDECEEWESDATAIIEEIGKCQFFGKSDTLEIHHDFIKSDLIHPFTSDVQKRIQKANIVTMIKFLSAVNECLHQKLHLNLRSMVNDILENMRIGGCLFFLDNAGGGIFKEIDQMIDRYPYCSKLYGPCLHNQHILDINTVEECSKLYSGYFRSLTCTKQMTVSCSTWIKNEASYDENESIWNPERKLLVNRKKKRKKQKVIKESKIESVPESSKNAAGAEKQNKYENKHMQKFLKDVEHCHYDDELEELLLKNKII